MRQNYYCIWRTFNKFFLKLDIKPKNWEDRLLLFVGYLVEKQLKFTSIRNYISAIKSVLVEIDVRINEDTYLLNSLIKACRYKNDRVRTQMPIQKPLLDRLLSQMNQHFMDKGQVYLCRLYRALLAAGYYGLLRVSKLTSGEHPMCVADVHIACNKNKLLFILRTSKTHWTDNKPQMVKISSTTRSHTETSKSTLNCPFTILKEYLAVRPTCKSRMEPFFFFSDRLPVRPDHLCITLKQSITQIGCYSSCYNTMSLRAGRACDLLKLGVSVETIKKLGRWKSNAVFTYL